MNTPVDSVAGPPAGPLAAGTVVLLRGEFDARVLMLHRQQALRSFGGYWVFPGGTVDDVEDTRARSGGGGTVAAAAAAACRELLEEAGLDLDVGALRHFAHWITPSALKRRFDTHFFVAAAPAGCEPQVADAEASEARWVDPRIWRSAAALADFPLTAPTLLVLREVAAELDAGGTMQGLLARAPGRRIRTVVPKMVDGGLVVLPWDPQYAGLPGDGVAWDAEGIAERAGWPGRMEPSRAARIQ